MPKYTIKHTDIIKLYICYLNEITLLKISIRFKKKNALFRTKKAAAVIRNGFF